MAGKKIKGDGECTPPFSQCADKIMLQWLIMKQFLQLVQPSPNLVYPELQPQPTWPCWPRLREVQTAPSWQRVLYSLCFLYSLLAMGCISKCTNLSHRPYNPSGFTLIWFPLAFLISFSSLGCIPGGSLKAWWYQVAQSGSCWWSCNTSLPLPCILLYAASTSTFSVGNNAEFSFSFPAICRKMPQTFIGWQSWARGQLCPKSSSL